jgi:hypothetical protein
MYEKVMMDRRYVFNNLQEAFEYIKCAEVDKIHNIKIEEIKQAKYISLEDFESLKINDLKGYKYNNYENIKLMSLDEMAQMLTEKQCQECGLCIDNDWKKCEQKECWCHSSNNYKNYKEWLLQEVE